MGRVVRVIRVGLSLCGPWRLNWGGDAPLPWRLQDLLRSSAGGGWPPSESSVGPRLPSREFQSHGTGQARRRGYANSMRTPHTRLQECEVQKFLLMFSLTNKVTTSSEFTPSYTRFQFHKS